MAIVLVGDCIEQMEKLHPRSVDLIVSDPPYNIGWNYDVYEDNKSVSEYVDWTEAWVRAAIRLLKPNGSFWLIIGDEAASDLDVLIRRKIGLCRRSWCVWYYSFGQNSSKKFTPSHAHLFHYVMNPKDFIFNGEAVKVPSARQLVYKDKRAKAGGRLPDDTWILRPQDCEGVLTGEADTWYIPRLCGTHKERIKGFPCQLPLALMERIIKVSSNPGDTVLDPFAGSGSTLVAAEKLGRQAIGIELSKAYADGIRKRLAA